LVLKEEARLKATNQEAADFAATLAKSTTVKVRILLFPGCLLVLKEEARLKATDQKAA
jgi:hypothetical protein